MCKIGDPLFQVKEANTWSLLECHEAPSYSE